MRLAAAPTGWLALVCLFAGAANAAITNPSFEADADAFFFTTTRFPIGWSGAPA